MVDRLFRASSKGADGGASVRHVTPVEECEHRGVEQGQGLHHDWVADRARVFTQSGIAAPVAAVFNLPVRLDSSEELGWGSLVG